jgi:2-hydroxychromene-2-carboxylate isomerase
MPRVTFWFEFASTYSYLSAMRIEVEAAKRGVEVAWRPVPLGPIFDAQGWRDSPFNIYPAKGRNMWRDMERQAAKLGLPPVTRPDPFPQNSLTAARAALIGLEEGWGADFAKAVFRAEFAEGWQIADPEVLADLLAGLGVAADVLERTQDPGVKAALKATGVEAVALGIYGAPSFVCADGELFWGNDRLEDALDWAAKG